MINFPLFFVGLRGAIAFALSINLDFEQDKRHVLITTTLIIVLFTLLILGGSTLPLLKVRATCFICSKHRSVQTNEQTKERTTDRMNNQTNGRTNGQTNRRMNV